MNPVTAMEGSFKVLSDCKKVRRANGAQDTSEGLDSGTKVQTWSPLENDCLKLNVDASIFPGTGSFSIGMMLRDHRGSFIEI